MRRMAMNGTWGRKAGLVAAMLLMCAAQVPAQQAERRIVVSLAERRLVLLEGDRVLKSYDVAVGAAATPSPTGEFRVVNRLTDPGYYKPGLVIPPGTSNPLGPRWMGLSKKTFGIHGTNDPQSIGHAASTGCIRMRNEEVVELFELVRVGDVVEILPEDDTRYAHLFPAGEPAGAVVATANRSTDVPMSR